MCPCEHGNECDETPTTWDDLKVIFAVAFVLVIFVGAFIGIGYHG